MFRKIITVLVTTALVTVMSAGLFAVYATDTTSTGTTTSSDTTQTASSSTTSKTTAAPAKPTKTKAQIRAEKYKKGLAAYIRSRNKKISKARSLALAGYFIKYGKKYKVDPKALMAMAQHESTFRAKAHNPAGYYGIMQTSASLGRAHGFSKKELYKPQNSIKVAASYLRYNLKAFHYSYTKGIAGYCCGTYAVKSGHYNKRVAVIRVKTRAGIAKYLKKHHYV
jgi:soluble lytic murein transglycosylase-like protein